MSASKSSSSSGFAGTPRTRSFSEETFYLEEFYGKSLLFAMVPPVGGRLTDFNSLVVTLRHLKRNQSRCIVIVPPSALPRLIKAMGRMAPSGPVPVFNPSLGVRSRPYPPDGAVAQIWEGLRAQSIVVASTNDDDADDLVVFAQELASRLSVFKLIFIDRLDGLSNKHGERLSFVESKRIPKLIDGAGSRVRRVIVRSAARALTNGVGSVNLVSPRGVYEELFSFIGSGTLFTETQYGNVRSISIDDFEEVEALILRGQSEGFLLERSTEQIAQILPSCFGYRIGDEHLAGICALLTDPYRRERVGEITALYTLTRFQGEGVAVELLKEVLSEARERMLRYVFACTSEDRAARFFTRLGFRRISAKDVPAAKWRGYDRARIARLSIFSYKLD